MTIKNPLPEIFMNVHRYSGRGFFSGKKKKALKRSVSGECPA
jgi:hypothetical protein